MTSKLKDAGGPIMELVGQVQELATSLLFGNAKPDPSKEIKERVDDRFFAVKEMTGDKASAAYTWDNAIKPLLPLLTLAVTRNLPAKYTVPVIMSVLFPYLNDFIVDVPVPPSEEMKPSLKEDPLFDIHSEHNRGILPEVRYGPAPPPPPIPPPLPDSYESDGVPFRGHIIMPRSHNS